MVTIFYLEKEIVISAGHHLDLDYESPCQKFHGHNYHIIIYCKKDKLDNAGMVVDFTLIKKAVMQFDHCDLNEKFDAKDNPTAEILAKRICELVPFCWKVRVEETPGSVIIYQKEDN